MTGLELVIGRALLLLILVASAVLGWRMLRRQGAVAYWIAGWAVAGMAGALGLTASELPGLAFLTHVFGALFAVMLLAGAFPYAGREPPVWLLPAGFAWAVLRGGLAAAGYPRWSLAMALAGEPVLALRAVWLVWRAVPRSGAGRAERWLGPGMLVLALVGALHPAWLVLGRDPALLVPLWLATVPPILALQIQATATRLRRRMRLRLEAMVAERTAALAQSEERYRAVSELSADLSFRVRVSSDLDLAFVWHSGPIGAITGHSSEALSGRGWMLLFDEAHHEQLRRRVAEMPVGRPFAFETEIFDPLGAPRWIAVRFVTAGRDPDGTLDLVGSASDVTEQHHAEEERRRLESHLQRVQRLESLGVLAGGIAHDFNNLLTVVRGNVRLALAELPADAPVRVRLERIDEATTHAAALTGQMLAYAGKAQPTLDPLDLAQVIESLRPLLEASVAESCAIEVECAPGLPAVEADDAQLRQVLLNLVMNGCEALGGRPGRVTVRSFAADLAAADLVGALGNELAAGRYVVLEVRDTGAGMDAATLARVCEPFFSTRFSGRGLGMAAVLGIVRSHGGALTLASAPGRGTTVRVLLPACDRPAVTAPARPALEPVAAEHSGRHVLVVDDDPAVAELAAELLSRAGFAVSRAGGGLEAIARVASEVPVDAVLLDLTMPDVGGEATFLRLRALRPDLPVVLLSGYDAEQVSQRFAARGLDGFVSKPFDPAELVAAVRKALRARAR